MACPGGAEIRLKLWTCWSSAAEMRDALQLLLRHATAPERASSNATVSWVEPQPQQW